VSVDGEPITDVGANLGRALERRGLSWEPLLRSNTVDLHPVWFGVYGSLIYHHGASFRVPLTPQEKDWIRDAHPFHGVPGIGRVVRRVRWSVLRRALIRRRQKVSDEVFDALMRDPDFWKRFEP
jgi:hypothetical protein